jgi:ribose transport system permease protein
VLRWTRFGRYIFAIGGNEHAATLTGVPVRRIKVVVYMISALSAGIAGIIRTGWLGAVTRICDHPINRVNERHSGK